ncbi:MAG TPA: hypothetical protein VG797_10025 [Phycisphaerales bacterium]|nr:hypothetical protein [Phycisphaerales bacterium]
MIDDLFDGDRSRGELVLPLPARGGIVAIVGPSGAGKSTMLRDVCGALRRCGVRVVDAARVRLGSRGCLELLGGDARTAMERMSRVGLAEAKCLVARADELSEGQKFRLRIAVALQDEDSPQKRRGRRGRTRGDGNCSKENKSAPRAVVIDEFGGPLDDVTARGVARLLRRKVDRADGLWVVVACTRAELVEQVSPDVRVEISLDGEVRVVGGTAVGTKPPPAVARRGGARRRALCRSRAPDARRGRPGRALDVRIEVGRVEDYRALAAWHYRVGEPATIEYVLSARERVRGELVGVLVVSRPVLNGAWREPVWGDRYIGGDKRLAAGRLNREVRCISRVIVEPRWRARGIAVGLVRAYLRSPLTRRTEAVAAMGGVCPFFRAAGMREQRLPVKAADARLIDAMMFAGVARWMMASPREAWGRIEEGGMTGFAARELRRWAMESGATRALLSMSDKELFEAACRRVCDGMWAYTWERVASAGDASRLRREAA